MLEYILTALSTLFAISLASWLFIRNNPVLTSPLAPNDSADAARAEHGVLWIAGFAFIGLLAIPCAILFNVLRIGGRNDRAC